MEKCRWSEENGEGKIEKICLPKDKGGARVVNIRAKNKSLMAKWCWRFAVDREALWRKIIATKYGSLCNIGVLEQAI